MKHERTDLTSHFSRAEYERRWGAVLGQLSAYDVDAVAVTAPHHRQYLTASLSSSQMTSPLILAPDRSPTYIVRSFDEDRIRAESPVPDLIAYFGEDDMIEVWADALDGLGLSRSRLGLELDCWGLTPHDVRALCRLLPHLRIVDTSRLVSSVMDVKSDEEIAVMCQVMEMTKAGLTAFYASLGSGVSQRAVYTATVDALLDTGSDYPDVQVMLGESVALPHAGGAPHDRLNGGGIAYAELSGARLGYYAGLVGTAVLGSHPRAEELHRIAASALDAIQVMLRPGVTTGEIDAAARLVVERAGRGDTFRHRTGYSIGCRWDDRGSTSIKPGGAVVVQPGMTFHTPIFLYERGQFGVGCSETWLVTDNGCKALSGLRHELVIVS